MRIQSRNADCGTGNRSLRADNPFVVRQPRLRVDRTIHPTSTAKKNRPARTLVKVAQQFSAGLNVSPDSQCTRSNRVIQPCSRRDSAPALAGISPNRRSKRRSSHLVSGVAMSCNERIHKRIGTRWPASSRAARSRKSDKPRRTQVGHRS
jgi:hypothetical protein